MTTNTPNQAKRSMLGRVFPRGESLIALAGLGAAGIMVAALGASTAWMMHGQRELLRQSRRDQTQAVATLLGKNAESMLGTGEVSALRAMVAGMKTRYGLSQVRIVTGGAVPVTIADSSKSAGFDALPEKWGGEEKPVGEAQVSHTAGATEVMVPLEVPGRGRAMITVRNETDYPIFRGWESQAGAGVIGVTSLTCFWLAYRGARRKLRGVGAVHESLRTLADGEQSAAALSVSPTLGAEAVAWNRLVSEAEQLRERVLVEKASDRLGNRRGGESELHSACDALWHGLVLVDDKMKVKFANGAAAVMLGMKREELSGMTAEKAIGEARVVSVIEKIATGGSRSRTSVEVERQGSKEGAEGRGVGEMSGGSGTGSLSVLKFTMRPLRKADAGGALVLIEDVTQQRVADESRNTFVASATHELRTPLTNMRLYVDKLVEEPDLSAMERTQTLNVVSGEVRRLERLVGDMLSVAEIEAGQLKLHRNDVRPDTIFDELKADFAEQAKQKEIDLAFELPQKWPQLTGDRDKIVLAMHNLVGNAIKYTPVGGKVVVKVVSDGKSLTVDVEDNGIGISSEDSDLIFDRFYRAKDRRIAGITGTGLGLSIAREVVRMHGGDILVRSQLDKGSTFTVNLPLAA